MIGVISKDDEFRIVQEFFELFKTPWEFYDANRTYDVVLITSDEVPAHLNTNALITYSSKKPGSNHEMGMAPLSKQKYDVLDWHGVEFPIYGNVLGLQPSGRTFLRNNKKSEIVGHEVSDSTRHTICIGYDLFQEVSFLLSDGQPSENAHIPTLEIHISLLRSCLLNAGISFVEIPPVPAGYDLMACLTHDVDFIGIREHKFDHTLLGFVYRASIGSLIDSLRGKLAWSKLLQNWRALFSLPLVYVGLRPDFWLEFDRYAQIEKGLGSTFFFIPFKNFPGMMNSRTAPKRRAAKYDVAEIDTQLRQLRSQRCEIGVHGIDAWHDSRKGRAERNRIAEATGQPEISGVRMHWLYFAKESPKALEEAGFSYDSTFGYNDAVGFRAGTTQVFRPLVADDLLELPLNIQDSAMFYPSRMNLTETEALDRCAWLIDCASKFGGILTLNWHTRSLSPERLWGDFYLNLLKKMQSKRVWFGTAEEAVKWFRTRRALRFRKVQFTEDCVSVEITGPSAEAQPYVLVRTHAARPKSTINSTLPIYSDTPWKGERELLIVSLGSTSIHAS